MNESESVQNGRIRDLENRVNAIENNISSILAKVGTLTTIAKAVALMVGAALGVDIIPLVGA
tara:strand:+ start:3683 stop:3868 length:186 start_codon:yes stop_codon:yes gene_type:complete